MDDAIFAFALNLEYLEATFYHWATTVSRPCVPWHTLSAAVRIARKLGGCQNCRGPCTFRLRVLVKE